MVLTVYNKDFRYVDIYEEFISLNLTRKFIPSGIFDLTVPATDKTINLFKVGNTFCLGQNKEMWIIENFKIQKTAGRKVLVLRGRDASSLFANRIILGNCNYIDKRASYCLIDIFNKHMKPLNTNRYFPRFNFVSATAGNTISFQNSYGEILEQYKKICETGGIGYMVAWDMVTEEFNINILQGTYRESVVFSYENDNVLDSSYQEDNTAYKTTAIVLGEGEDTNRKMVVVNDNFSGFNRRELYVDARDLQSKIRDDNGNETTLSNSEYEKILKQRGLEKLAQQEIKRQYDAKIRTNIYGSVLGVDFYLGDIVKVKQEFNIESEEQVTEISEKYDQDGQEIIPRFGKNILNILDKIKRS